MSFFEDPDYTGKAPEHVANAIKNLSEFGRTSIEPSSKKYEIIIKKITERTSFTNKYGKTISFDDGYLLSHKSKDLFYEILNDIKALPGRFYLPITKGETYWVIPTSSEKELADFIEKYSLDAPIPITKPETDILDTAKEHKDFNIGDIVLVHWYNSLMPTEILRKAFGKGKIIDISIFSYNVELLEEGSDRKDKGYVLNIPKSFSDVNFLEHYKYPDFNVGDIVTAHWEFDSKEHNVDAVITKKLYDGYRIKLLSNSFPFKEGDEIFNPKPFTEKVYLEFKYGETITKKTSPSEGFKVGDIVDIHWSENDGKTNIVVEGIIKELNDIGYNMEITGEPKDSTLFTKGERITIAKKGRAGYRESDYITHKTKTDIKHDFKVGEIVTAHWMYEKYPRSVKAKIIKISDAQIDVVSTEDKTYTEEGVSASYKAGDKRFFYRPFTDTRYIEKITEHDDTGFKVGDLVNAYWEYDSKHLSAQAKIVKISESIGFYKEKGHKSLFETELIEGTSDARYKKGSKVVFGYPFDKDFYLEHTLKTSYPTDFVIGEEVTVHHKVPDREIVIRGIVHELSPEYVTVKYTETVEMYEKGKLENIPIPFNKWNFITKDTGTTLKPLTIESVEVGEHVTAHWIQRGVDKLARVKITSRRISSGKIDFELLEPVTLDTLYGNTLYETGTTFLFSYPFTVYEFLTRDSYRGRTLLSPEESKRHDELLDKALDRDFKVGDIVIAHWTSDRKMTTVENQKVSVEAKITAISRTSYHVELLHAVPDTYIHFSMYPKGVVKYIPTRSSESYNELNRLEHKVSSTKKHRSTSFVDYFPPASSKIYDVPFGTFVENFSDILADMFKKPIPTDEEMGMRAATYEDDVKKYSDKITTEEDIRKSYPTVIKSTTKSHELTLASRVAIIEEGYIAEAKKLGRTRVEATELTKMLKQILKLYWPDIKFSARHKSYSMGDSIDVTWDDGPESSEVSKVIGKYHNKGFDGSTDSSYSIDVPWDTDYVYAQRNYK